MADSVLCVVAHPDDETMLTGGLLAALARAGVAVDLLCATRGEGGEVGDPPVCAREELGLVRESELRCAAMVLGVRSVEFMGYIDPPVAPGGELQAFVADFAECAERIAETMARLRPALALTHGSQGEYGHPGHVLVHRAVLRAREVLGLRGGVAPALYTFCAAVPGLEDRLFNAADQAHIVFDVGPWLDIKAAAAACHRTQHALFFRHHPEAHVFRDIVRGVEALRLVWSQDGSHAPLLIDLARASHTLAFLSG